MTETNDRNEVEPLNQLVVEENGKAKEKRSFSETCTFIFKNITVEPTIFLFIIGALLSTLTTQNLSIEKACRVNLNFTYEICQSLKQQNVQSQNEYEHTTQQFLARFLSVKTYFTATVPCVLAILAGSWSDKTGRRKMFAIIPVFGQILIAINNMINTYYFMQLPLEVLIFSEAILDGFTGSWCLLMSTAFAFVSAITTDKDRTFRMGLLSFSMTVGFPIGMGLSGIILKKFGYYGSYGLCAILQTVNLMYTVFILKDPIRTVKEKQYDNKGCFRFCRTFFDASNLTDSIRVVFKNGPNNRRLRMCFMMLAVSCIFGPMFGEISVTYMSTRYRFGWNEVRFSLFQTYNFILHTIGTMFSLFVLSKRLKWHDSVLGIISTVSKMASSFVYCFATTEIVFFAGPLVEILNGTSLLAMRSIMSKFVSPNDLGKVSSMTGLVENLMPLVFVPMYVNVYKATMDVFPGAVFLMGTVIIFPAVLVFLWIFVDYRTGANKFTRVMVSNQES